jgi:transcriptional regulator with XRE-family HTH domain
VSQKAIYLDTLAPGLPEGERFMIARRRAGLRQVDVARELGTWQPRLSLWERGQVSLSPETVSRAWAMVERVLAA